MKILYTAAYSPDCQDIRKCEYSCSLKWFKSHGYDPYIVECYQTQGPLVYEEYTNKVFYACVNNTSLKNKGVNEAQAILKALDHYKFSDDEMIVKVTGRYQPRETVFLDIASNAKEDVVCMYIEDQIFTGVVALRCGLFRQMLNSFDYKEMEEKTINIERKVARYIENNKVSVQCVGKVHFLCNIAFQGDAYL